MIDALIGSAIAVIATSSLALMLEAMSSSAYGSKSLNLYNSRVVARVVARRSLSAAPDLEEKVVKWMSDQANDERYWK